jgi:hypothetical protein
LTFSARKPYRDEQMQRRGRSLFVLGILGLGLGLGGCSLILDFDDPPPPADASQPDAIDSAACEYGEPNDQRSMAAVLDPITGTLAGICEDGDRDFYSLTIGDAQMLSFEIVFVQEGARGDLDMRLLDVNGEMVSQSLSLDADEKIVCPGEGPHCEQLAAGNYFIEVYGFSDSTKNAYTINYELSP